MKWCLYWILIPILCTGFLLAGCGRIKGTTAAGGEQEDSNSASGSTGQLVQEAAETGSGPEAPPEESTLVYEFKPVWQGTADLDGDGKSEGIGVFLSKDRVSGMNKIKIIMQDTELLYDIKPELYLDSLREPQVIRTGKNGKALLLSLYSSEIENGSINNASPYIFERNILAAGYDGKKPVILLDGMNQPYNEAGNYTVKYRGSFKMFFEDRATGLTVEYKLLLDPFLASVYKERLPQFDDFGVGENISWNYYQIGISDTDGDGSDEITCSKGVPGLYHDHMLGDIRYLFKFRDGQYRLVRETFAHSLASAPGGIIREIELEGR